MRGSCEPSAVVPANAGTHNPKCSLLRPAARKGNAHRLAHDRHGDSDERNCAHAGVPASAGTTKIIPAARCARVLHLSFAQERAWGTPGAQCTRSLVCEWVVQNAHEYSQWSHRKSPGIPARNGFNGFLRALPGDRLSCHPHRQRLGCRLDAGVEASGPHDFSVREFKRSRQKRRSRPPHPAPRL